MSASASASASYQDETQFAVWQQVAITVAAVLSAGWSLTGSAVIATMAYSRRYSVKYRLLLALSVADIINSGVFLVWPLPIPADTPGVWGARGNGTTCAVQGFFLQLGILGSFYNAALSGYFMLTLCDRLTEAQITQRYERITHAVSLAWSVGTAVAALWPLNLYSVCALGCWIAPEPVRCHTRDDVSCVRNNHAYLYVWVFTGIPLLLCLGFIIYTMVRIYTTVRSVSVAADRITFRAHMERLGGGDDIHHPNETPATTTTNDHGVVSQPTTTTTITTTSNNHRTVQQQQQQQQQSRYAVRVKETATQAFLYVAAYVITHLFAFLCVIIEQAGGTNPFLTIFLENLLWPLQGFLNVFVFLRPKVQSLRKDANVSYGQAVIWAAFHDGQDPRTSNHHNHHNKHGRRAWRQDKTRLTSENINNNQRSSQSQQSETPVGMARRLSNLAHDSHMSRPQDSFYKGNHNHNNQQSQVDSTVGVRNEESKCEDVDDPTPSLSATIPRFEGGGESTLRLEPPHQTVQAISNDIDR